MYILVVNSAENRAVLKAVGVTDEQILGAGNEEPFVLSRKHVMKDMLTAIRLGGCLNRMLLKRIIVGNEVPTQDRDQGITCKLLKGSELFLSESDHVLDLRIVEMPIYWGYSDMAATLRVSQPEL
ncbi:hypothetical protein PBAT_22270 [Paenibacillus antarcticus]|uniref:Uncharacterized protein n=2 Tax=Paenibacillus antarcticus TaxID=253703 RepID=A0A168JYJ1_9BACL|nr:hypothetical protein [Paenibacillus antarcticus]OAB41276.1 hypothetical protein PBAT_22270 [Paenibacillus antarcticus]